MNPFLVALLVTFSQLDHSTSAAHARALAAMPASTPVAAVARLADAYNLRSLSDLDALLTADFRFHFSANDSAGLSYAEGLSRNLELQAADGIFNGTTGKYGRPAPDSLVVSAGSIEEGVDPEHPDSTCQYRLAIVHDFTFRLVFVRDSMVAMSTPAMQIFHVVRGDAAVRMPGQAADTTHWYLRRWLEDLDAVTIALGKLEGECSGGPGESGPVAIAPTVMSLRAIGVPLCPTLKVLCDLPGTEPALLEVYDLQGRRLAQRSVTPQSPGSALVEAGGGRHFTPGAYWIRLTQGRRTPVTRMVMVAR